MIHANDGDQTTSDKGEMQQWRDAEDQDMLSQFSKKVFLANCEALSRVKICGEAAGLPESAVETAQAVALGTIEGGRSLRRGT